MALQQRNGLEVFAPVLLPDSQVNEDLEIIVKVPRCTSGNKMIFTDPNTWIQVDTEASFDGGVTWVHAGGFGCWGGIHVRRDGTEAAFSNIVVRYGGSAKNRLLRSTMMISKPTMADLLIETRRIAKERPV